MLKRHPWRSWWPNLCAEWTQGNQLFAIKVQKQTTSIPSSKDWHCKVMCMLSHSVMSSSLQPLDCSLPGSSIHGVLHARKLEWVSISYSIVRPSEILYCFEKGKEKSCPFTGHGGERGLLITAVFRMLWCQLVLSLAGMVAFLVNTFYWTQTFLFSLLCIIF